MNSFEIQRIATKLDTHAVMRVFDGKGRGLAVLDGLVWVTQDGDRRDIFVGRGESFTFDRPGLAIVEALEPTHLFMLAAS